ncbi:hypothetical protein [uncultured Tateyamaria sp.]|uniref:hypothetical protein n=1 Tax=uncultured Tateyamaria sp. TaxID=455651 RepID=UPI00262290F3|nr:hypothetical protein [uncultured Tateyamaria sp.]
MAGESGGGHASPSWFVAPGEGDSLAWISLIFIALALYGLVSLYAAFDRWAEHQSKGTPLAKTIPTMLTIALLYEIFPLGHFNILLPLSAILIALMADWSRFNLRRDEIPSTEYPDAATQTGTDQVEPRNV